MTAATIPSTMLHLLIHGIFHIGNVDGETRAETKTLPFAHRICMIQD